MRVPYSVFVSITRLHLRSARFLPGFIFYNMGSTLQAILSEGNIRVRLRKMQGLTFWTLTHWSSAETMMKFRNAAIHRQAMAKLKDWCDESSYAHWTSQELVDWKTAEQKLSEQGKLSHVNYPSVAHREGKIRI